MKIDFFTESDTDKLIEYIRNNYNPNLPLVLYVDSFCGCGGVTEGIIKNENNFVVACINHDEFAIKSHHKNHPYCIHYVEDIRNWELIRKLEILIARLRKEFPGCLIVLHASLECTHISKAKGGVARDADSRTLSFHLEKYLCFKPDYITIENVEEILTNGPLDEHGQAIEELKGIDYTLWVEMLESYGYKYDYRMLNAADFGEHTSRKRYFGIFAHGKLPITFPKPTHVTKKDHHKFPHLKVHRPVREKLKLHIEGRSIFGLTLKGKPYVDKTILRTYHGVKKHIKEGAFTVRYNGGDPSDKNGSINKPLGTILTANTHSLVQPVFISSYYGDSQDGRGILPLDKPLNTITTKDRFSLHHLQYEYTNGGKGNHSSIEKPAGTITTTPKHQLITSKFLTDTQFKRVGMSVNKPSPTIIASQNKKPLYIVSANNYNDEPIDNSIPIPGDSKARLILKSFMREHGIIDIKIRALDQDELLTIQGFPPSYILVGGKVRALKYIGNSVCPGMAKAFTKAIYDGIVEHFKQAA